MSFKLLLGLYLSVVVVYITLLGNPTQQYANGMTWPAHHHEATPTITLAMAVVPGSEDFIQTYSSDDGSISLVYPSTWTVVSADKNLILLVNAPKMPPLPLPSGNALVLFAPNAHDIFSLIGYMSTGPFEDDFSMLSNVSNVEIQSQQVPVSRINLAEHIFIRLFGIPFHSDSGQLSTGVYVTRTQDGKFPAVALLTNPGELETFEPQVLAMVRSKTLPSGYNPPETVQEFGPNAVAPQALWQNLSNDPFSNCYQSSIGLLDCVDNVMQTEGASSEARAFTKAATAQLQNPYVMTSFTEMGKVDLANIFSPGGANSFSSNNNVLLNGIPEIVDVSDVGNLIHNPAYQALSKGSSNLFVAGTNNIFEVMDQPSEGGQRFIFDDMIMECHACGTVGYARIAFNFDSAGHYFGIQLLSVVPGEIPTPVNQRITVTGEQAQQSNTTGDIDGSANNLPAQVINNINATINHFCTIGMFDPKICSDTIGWIYNDPLLGASGYLSDATDITSFVAGVSPGGLALNTITIYPALSECVTGQDRNGFKPCVDLGLGIAAVAAVVIGSFLELPLLAVGAIVGGIAALKFLLQFVK